jgi:RimJ/RimL family protein N-acetyltransferase
LDAPQVIALTVQGNSGSWGLMERLGMERRADLDFANADFDPETGRIIVYAISADQWRHRA